MLLIQCGLQSHPLLFFLIDVTLNSLNNKIVENKFCKESD